MFLPLVFSLAFLGLSSARSVDNVVYLLERQMEEDMAMDAWLMQGLFTLTDSDHAAHGRYARSADPVRSLINIMFQAADKDKDAKLNLDEFWQTFETFDGNGDGEIRFEEYHGFFSSEKNPAIRMLRAKGHLQRNAERLFRAGDLNDDEKLDEQDARSILNRLDRDHDGLIDQSEYMLRWKEVLEKIEN